MRLSSEGKVAETTFSLFSKTKCKWDWTKAMLYKRHQPIALNRRDWGDYYPEEAFVTRFVWVIKGRLIPLWPWTQLRYYRILRFFFSVGSTSEEGEETNHWMERWNHSVCNWNNKIQKTWVYWLNFFPVPEGYYFLSHQNHGIVVQKTK